MADYLPSANTRNLVAKSSIAQDKDHVLSVFKAGRYVPIAFDYIDYIDCDKVVSHQVIVTDSCEAPYRYPVGKCKYVSEIYLTSDKTEEDIKPLPCWFGEGWYREWVDKRAYTNFDDQALGVKNVEPVEIGLEYIEAKTTI